MKLDKEDLKIWLMNAYEGTCHQYNTKGDIDSIDIDAIYEMLGGFEIKNRFTKRTFELYPMHLFSDGGIKEFLIICEIGSFRFMLVYWRYNSFGRNTDEVPCGFEPFVDWLYKKLKPLPDLKIEEKLIFNENE